MNPLRQILNRYRWTEGFDALEIDYDFRADGAAMTLTARGSRVEEILPGGLTLQGAPEPSFLPYHRVSQVRSGGEVVYRRGAGGG